MQTEKLVVGAVVRRVDDPLVLPGAPGVRTYGGKRDSEAAGELLELCAPLADLHCRLGEARATARSDLDLGRDQLADEVLFERRPLRRGLELLEAVGETEGLRIENRELLLDRKGEVLPALVGLPREAELLLWGELLGVAHRGVTLVGEGLQQSRGDPLPAPPSDDCTSRGVAQRLPLFGRERQQGR